jgi:hypothetical protein
MKKQDLEYKYKSALETLSQEWIEKFFDEWKLKLKKEMIFEFLQDLSELDEKVDVEKIMKEIEWLCYDIDKWETFYEKELWKNIKKILESELKASSDIDKQVEIDIDNWDRTCECGECSIDYMDKYCKNCGSKINWLDSKIA